MLSDTCHAPRATLLTRFVWSLVLNAGLAIGELVMSLLTGSTALLADGLNNLDDTAALLLSIYSERVARRPADRRHTFGHQRMDVVAGFAKGCFLLFAVVLILYRVGCFLLEPVVVPGTAVFVTACIALTVNLLSALWLKHDACHSMNARGTYLCMVYDAIGSAAVMLSAVATLLFGFAWFDVIASLVIVVFMSRSGLALLRESTAIFMQTAPIGFDYDTFTAAVRSIPNVAGIGDIHVWSHTAGDHHLTCRVAVEISEFCECDRVVKAVEELCLTQFNIQHCTIQLVYAIGDLAETCGAPPQ